MNDDPTLLDGITVGTAMTGSAFRSLLYFDLDLLPTDTQIESAYLCLYAFNMKDKKLPVEIRPYLLTSEWNRSDIDGGNHPNVNRSVSGGSLNINDCGWYKFDITGMIKNWTHKNYHGIMLEPVDGKQHNIVRMHHSKSTPDPQYAPYLEIKYQSGSHLVISTRNTINCFEYLHTECFLKFSAWRNISSYSMYTYFVQNVGDCPAHVFVQISPNRSAIYNETKRYRVGPDFTEAIVPQKYGFYIRLAFLSPLPEQSTRLKIWLQAQV